MPHATFPVTQDGYLVPVVVGLTGKDATALLSAGQPAPKPLLLQGEIDTGTNITCVSARALTHLALTPASTSHSTRTVGGSLPVRLFEVSLSIPLTGRLQASLLVLDQLVVMEWSAPLPGNEVLIGRDVLPHLLALLDGPRNEFTLAD
jgi:hypothetical protein